MPVMPRSLQNTFVTPQQRHCIETRTTACFFSLAMNVFDAAAGQERLYLQTARERSNAHRFCNAVLRGSGSFHSVQRYRESTLQNESQSTTACGGFPARAARQDGNSKSRGPKGTRLSGARAHSTQVHKLCNAVLFNVELGSIDRICARCGTSRFPFLSNLKL